MSEALKLNTVVPNPRTIDVPADVLKAFKKIVKDYRYMTHAVAATGLNERTIKSITTNKYCAPQTLERLYEITGITPPQTNSDDE